MRLTPSSVHIQQAPAFVRPLGGHADGPGIDFYNATGALQHRLMGFSNECLCQMLMPDS